MFRSAKCHALFSIVAVAALICSGCGKVPTWGEITGKSKTEDDASKTGEKTDSTVASTEPNTAGVNQYPGQNSSAPGAQNPGQKTAQPSTSSVLKAAVVQRYGSLEKCQVLNLSGSNPLSASMLDELKDLPKLEHLMVGGRKLDSNSMKAIGELKTLKGLYLDSAQFSPFDLERLGSMSGLRILNVSRTQVTDQSLELIKHLDLDVLQVQNCGEVHGVWFTAKGRDKWFGGGLKMIDADLSRFGDGGFIYINVSDEIEILTATQAGVEDGRLTGLRGCKNLRFLTLRENAISDFGTKELMKLSNLEVVDLNAENLTDMTLQWMKGLKKLKRMFPGPKFTEQSLQLFHAKFSPNITYGEVGTFEQAAGLTAIQSVQPLLN